MRLEDKLEDDARPDVGKHLLSAGWPLNTRSLNGRPWQWPEHPEPPGSTTPVFPRWRAHSFRQATRDLALRRLVPYSRFASESSSHTKSCL